MKTDQLRAALTTLTAAPPSARELAEILWLAHHLGHLEPASLPEPKGNSFSEGLTPPADTPPPVSLAGSDQLAEPHPPALYARTTADENEDSLSVIGLLVPAAPALGERLALQRALRPLKRLVPSLHEVIIDEEDSADRIADQPYWHRIWLPVVRPADERWLDLSLVVDRGSSMTVWVQLAEELRDLVIESGIFRTITVWTIATDHPTRVTVASSGTTAVQPPKAVLRSGGRHLIAVLSDCSGAAWHGGAAGEALAIWGRHGPVVILQPLPERLWPRTGAPTTLGRVVALSAACPNGELDFAPYDGLPRQPAGTVAIPVLEISPSWFGRWAAMVSSGGSMEPAAVAFHLPGETKRRAEAPVRSSARQLVLGFHAAASPQAFQLARCLATTTPALPVMRLVQRAVLGKVVPAYLAEVILSGLLRASDGQAGRYEFIDGVREVLLDAATRSEAAMTMNVIAQVSAAIERDAGVAARRFRALISGDRYHSDELAAGPPFALISPQASLRLRPQSTTPPTAVHHDPPQLAEMEQSAEALALSDARPRRESEVTLSKGTAREEAWFEDVYRSHHNRIVRMLTFALRGNMHAAEEIYQDTMQYVWTKRSSLPDGPKLEAWIIKTAKNRLLNHITKKSNRTHWALDELPSHQDVTVGADSWIDDSVEIGPISSLSLADRQVLILVLGYEFNAKEAAQILGIKPAAVRQRLKRARHNARELTFDRTDSVSPEQLRDRAANDGNAAVRAAAVRALAAGYVEDPGTLPLLRDRAVNDEHPVVREAAVQAVAAGYAQDPGTLTWLRDRAANDENAAVRAAAVQASRRGM